MRTALGYGPLVEAVAHDLAVAGGPVYAVPINASVAGVAGSVSYTRASGTASTGTLAVTGAPYDDFQVRIQITRDGANLAAGTAAFIYSLDGGDNYSPEIAVPTGGVYSPTGTGLTLTWSNGAGTAFRTGDIESFDCTAPGYASNDITAAVTVALARTEQYEFIHLVGKASAAAGTATVFGVLDTLMTTAETAYRYIFAIMQAADDTDSNLEAAFASLTSRRVAVCAGFEELISPISGRKYKRPISWSASSRVASIPIGQHLGRVRTGPIANVTAITRDERLTPGMDEARFLTTTTLIGLAGFWFTRGRLMSPTGSDFEQIHHRRVMDTACRIARAQVLQYLNDDLQVDNAGLIDEATARDIEANVGVALRAAIVQTGQASDSSIVIDRAANILSTGTVPVKVRVRPKGYAEHLSVDIGFVNPALVAALAS